MHLFAISWLHPSTKGHSSCRLLFSSPILSKFWWPVAFLSFGRGVRAPHSHQPHDASPSLTDFPKSCLHLYYMFSNALFGGIYYFLPRSLLSSLSQEVPDSYFMPQLNAEITDKHLSNIYCAVNVYQVSLRLQKTKKHHFTAKDLKSHQKSQGICTSKSTKSALHVLNESFPPHQMEKPAFQLLYPWATCPTWSPANQVPIAPGGIISKLQYKACKISYCSTYSMRISSLFICGNRAHIHLVNHFLLTWTTVVGSQLSSLFRPLPRPINILHMVSGMASKTINLTLLLYS